MKKLQLFFGMLMIICFGLTIFSCNTTGVSPTNYSRFQIVNALAGSTPINFYFNFTKKNSATVTFPATSGYVSTTPGAYFIQFSLATTPSIYFYQQANLTLKTDSSYSIFLTGQAGKDTTIFIRDSLSNPSVGKAKIRFVNASTNAGAVDVTVNAIAGFSKVNYLGVTSFIEVPAGTYEFKANQVQTGTNTTITNLATLSRQVLTNGKIYTLYAAGQIGSTETNAAFGLNLITNLLPATK